MLWKFLFIGLLALAALAVGARVYLRSARGQRDIDALAAAAAKAIEDPNDPDEAKK